MSDGRPSASPWAPRLWLALFCVAASFTAIVGKPLTTHDETRVAGIAREMAVEGHYAVPRLDGHPFLEYPSLGYLPAAALLHLRGSRSDFLTLLPSALAALATLWLTFLLGRRIAGETAGLVAVLVLQNMIGFVSLFARVLVDPLLVFWITLSLTGAAGALAEERPRRGGALLFQLGMAGAFLTKGPIGIALPAAVATGFVLARRRWRALPRLLARGAPLLLLAPIGAWTWRVWVDGGAPLALEIWQQSVTRFLSASADHAHSFIFYLGPVLYLLVPMTLLLPWLVRDAISGAAREEGPGDASLDSFPWIWLVVALAGLSLASAKRNIYLGPLYPAAALAVGVWWVRQEHGAAPSRLWAWLRSRLPRRPSSQALALGLLLLVHAGVQVGLRIPNARRHDPTPIFTAADRWQRAGPDRQIVLVEPKEAMSGAATYVLGRVVPRIGPGSWPPAPPLAQAHLLLVGRQERIRPLLDALPADRRGPSRTLPLGRDVYCLCQVLPAVQAPASAAPDR